MVDIDGEIRNTMELLRRFQQSVANADENLVREYFGQLQEYYTEPDRHYHTLQHIESLLQLASEYSGVIQKKTVVDLAIFYHDVVYVPGRNDNEIRSAEMARDALHKLNIPLPVIADVSHYILATRDHFSVTTYDSDLKYFLDFDLSILSADAETYQQYAKQIRKEYAAIPNMFYNPGRISFLKKALQLPHLYFTEDFRKKESKAKANIQWEIKLLEQG